MDTQCSGGQAENLSFRPTEACQLEGSLFDAFCQPQTTEIGMYDQTGGSHVLLVSP